MLAKSLTATSKLFTLLAVACCVLGVLSINTAQADPVPIVLASCGGDGANGCTGAAQALCVPQGTDCRTRANGACTCKWTNGTSEETNKCGCWANAPVAQ